jgi:hypothetical protein
LLLVLTFRSRIESLASCILLLAELEAAIADFVFTDEQQRNADDLIASFQAKFPRQALPNLTLERYAVGTESSKDGFWMLRSLESAARFIADWHPIGRLRYGIIGRLTVV